MKTIFILSLLIFTFSHIPKAKAFHCEAHDIISVKVFSPYDNRSGSVLNNDLSVEIAGHMYNVKRENIVGYWNQQENYIHDFRLFIKNENEYIKIQVSNHIGHISLDFKGVRMDRVKAYCDFSF